MWPCLCTTRWTEKWLMNASNIQPLRSRQPLNSSLRAVMCTLKTHSQWISLMKTDKKTNPGSVGLGTVTKLRLKLRMNDCCCCLRGRFISTVTQTHMHTLTYRPQYRGHVISAVCFLFMFFFFFFLSGLSVFVTNKVIVATRAVLSILFAFYSAPNSGKMHHSYLAE